MVFCGTYGFMQGGGGGGKGVKIEIQAKGNIHVVRFKAKYRW